MTDRRKLPEQVETTMMLVAVSAALAVGDKRSAVRNYQDMLALHRAAIHIALAQASVDARAERDALKAAVARVRAVEVTQHDGPCGGYNCDAPDGAIMLAADVLAALDLAA